MQINSNTTYKRLIQAGITLAKKQGLKFSVRELCKKSKVNLGLFHYYFKNKDNFDKELLKAVYNQMLEGITPNITQQGTPYDNIENILLGLYKFSKDNRMFLSSLLGDVLSGDKKLLQFMSQNFTQHFALLTKELSRTKLTPLAKKQALPGLTASLALPIVFPQIIMGLFERIGTNNLDFKPDLIEQAADDEQQVRNRINMLLKNILGDNK